jgi:hypothetical protein
MLTTSRLLRRTSTWPSRVSVCFHSMPASSSCRQMALGITMPSPFALFTTPSKYLMWPRQSQPSCRLLAVKPMP